MPEEQRGAPAIQHPAPLSGTTSVIYEYASTVGNLNTAGQVVFKSSPGGVFQPSYVPFAELDICPGFAVPAFGDFNGDGVLDVAFGCGSSSTNQGLYLSVILGRADGNFEPATHYPIATNSTASPVIVGDFNNDGIPDLLTASFAQEIATCPVTLLVYPGKGDGTFGSPIATDVPISFDWAGLAFASDLDGDGNLDLFASIDPSQYYVLAGRGDGTFEPNPRFTFGVNYDQALNADLNGDGHTDLVLFMGSSQGQPGEVGVQLGKADGTFGALNTFHVTGIPSSVEPIGIGDVDGDGKPDLVVGGTGWGTGAASLSVYLLRGNGNGTFGSPQLVLTSGNGLTGALGGALGDFDGDGRVDILLPFHPFGDAGLTSPGGIAILRGAGNSTFAAPEIYQADFGGLCCSYVGPLGN